jgi:hypothetical protein
MSPVMNVKRMNSKANEKGGRTQIGINARLNICSARGCTISRYGGEAASEGG